MVVFDKSKKEMVTKLLEYFMKNHSVYYNDMKNSSHHYDNTEKNPYHGEGSVWTHTCMVIHQLMKNNEYISLELLVAALLHDVGKPYTRTIKDRKVRFFGHHSKSFYEAMHIIKHIQNDLPEFNKINALKILKLIYMHMVFFCNKLTITEYAKMFNGKEYGIPFLEELFILINADKKGRIIDFDDDITEFKNELINKVKELFDNTTFNTYTNEVVFLIGTPYSGKSYYTKYMKNNSKSDYKNFEIVSRDDMIDILNTDKEPYDVFFKKVNQNTVNTLLEHSFNKNINENKNIIVDMTNMSKKARRSKLLKFPKSYKKTAIVFLTDMELITKRMLDRDKKVPASVINEMVNGFSLPDYSEFHEIKFLFPYQY